MKVYTDRNKFVPIFTIEHESLFGRSDVAQVENPNSAEEMKMPRFQLHLSINLWSSFTSLLREHFLPWRWKVAYLDTENEAPLQRILVCVDTTDKRGCHFFKELLTESPFVKALRNNEKYAEYYDHEYFWIPNGSNQEETVSVTPSFASVFGGGQFFSTTEKVSPIYRQRSVFSMLQYYILRAFSSSWQEVAVNVEGFRERVLVKTEDLEQLKALGILE